MNNIIYSFNIGEDIVIKILLIPVRYRDDKRKYVEITVTNKTEIVFNGTFEKKLVEDFRRMLWAIIKRRHHTFNSMKHGGGISTIISDTNLSTKEKTLLVMKMINDNLKN
ncbi:hypothetical protein [Microcystis phage Mel-JY01]